MTSRKGRKRPVIQRSSRRAAGSGPSPGRLGWLALALVLIAALAWAWREGWLGTGGESRPAQTTDHRPQATVPTPPAYEIPDVAREEEPADSDGVLPAHGPARVALVIDDLGRSVEDVDRLERLEVPIAFAVLPFETLTPEVVARVSAGGHELICHLPMEPSTGANPGPGALTSGMSRRQLADATRNALDAVGGAVGVNNHMGSGLTTDERAMSTILRVVGNRNLYFLDSRTSADSVGYEVAVERGIPAVRRDVFLDGELTREWVDGQMRRALGVARERGSAVVIGHPHAVTLEALEDWVPRAVEAGYQFVPVTALLERPGGPSL